MRVCYEVFYRRTYAKNVDSGKAVEGSERGLNLPSEARRLRC